MDGWSTDAKRISKQMIQFWASFARDEQPSAAVDGHEPYWGPVDTNDDSQMPVLLIDAPLSFNRGFRHDECTFWFNNPEHF